MTATMPGITPIDSLDRPPTVRIARLSRRLRRQFDHLLEPYDLTGVQFGLLNRLLFCDGLVQADLGRRMVIEPATLTGIVQRLEREGWLRRSCDPENRRLQRVWLTDKAKEALPAMRRIQSRHRRRVLAGLTVEEIAVLENLLERIEENLR